MKTYTLEEFNDLVHELNVAKWGALGKAHCAIRKDFKLTKTKHKEKKQYIDTMEDGIPVRRYIKREGYEAVDTNSISKLYCKFAEVIYGINLERKNAEGSFRKYGGREFYKKSTDKGRADLMMKIPLKYGSLEIGIEVKQKNESLLPSQKKFRDKLIADNGKYYVARSFEQFQEIMVEIVNFVKTIKQ
jgi:hypothetical protein